MQFSKHWLLVFVLATSSIECARAATATIVLTGDSSAGVAGGLFETVTHAVLGNGGKIVFSADMQSGAGGVDPGNASGVWSYDQGILSLIARQGVGNVPEVASANFDLFRSIAIGDNGDVFLRGSLESGVGGVDSTNEEGIWKYAGGASIVARTGDTPVPGVSNGLYDLLPNQLRVAGNGLIAVNASMAISGGVSPDTDAGTWTFDDLGGTLYTREGTTNAPGFSSIFNNFAIPTVNDDQQIAFRSSLEINGAVNTSNEVGIWRYSPLGGYIIAREGSDQVPGLPPTADFDEFQDPLLNGSDQVTFHSTLVHSASIDSTNDEGVWLYTGATGTLIAQTGSGGVPGIAGADFLSLGVPLLSDTGDVVVQGELVTGVGGVTASNNQGLWRFDGVSASQVARTGGADVPGISGASFDEFEKHAVNSAGQIALKATLQNGGSIDPNNDSGLWLMQPGGQGILIAREGDNLEGRIISALDFAGGSGGNDGISAGLNDEGELLFWAEFTNGDSGLFLFRNLLADFDLDGDVDSDDLTDPTLGWEARYGVDLNGLDFLQWQQELGKGVPLSVTLSAVPEPSAFVIFSTLSALPVYCRRRS